MRSPACVECVVQILYGVVCMTEREHLPPLTADLVITTLQLEAHRELIGWECCRDKLVGTMRRMLGNRLSDPDSDDPSEEARNTSRMLLGELCHVCPHQGCKMKVW